MESCAIKVDIIINPATEPDCVGAFPSSHTLPQEKKKILYTEAETSSTVHRGCGEFYSTQKLWGVLQYTETETCSTVHRSWDVLHCTQKLWGALLCTEAVSSTVHRICEEFYWTQKLWVLLYTEAVRSSLVHRSCEDFYCTQNLWGVLLNTEAVRSSTVQRSCEEFYWTQKLWGVLLNTEAVRSSAVHIRWDTFCCKLTLRQFFYCTAVNEDDNWRCSGVPSPFKTSTWPCKEWHYVPCLAASSMKHPWSVCQSALGHQSQPWPSKSHSLQLITNHTPRPPVD